MSIGFKANTTMAARFRDLTGQTFRRLTVVEYAGTRQFTNGKESQWKCRCVCGTELIVPQRYLVAKSSGTRSCGCLIGQHKRTHGATGTPTFRVWTAMHNRCSNPKHNSYKDYGGRGIQVCERWGKFENFLADMGERPDGMSIDRYPSNDGNYEPGNCRWASATEQSNNRRSSRMVTFNGETRTCAEWERHVGLSVGIVSTRLEKGFTEEEALSTVLHNPRPRTYRPRAGKHRLTLMQVGDVYRNDSPTKYFRKVVINTGARRGMKFRSRRDGAAVVVTRIA